MLCCCDESGSRVLYMCACSPSGSSNGGAVRVGDGVAPEHRPGQELHLALLRERPAAGDVSHRCLGVRITVSFSTPLHTLLVFLVVLIYPVLGPESAFSERDR